MTEPTQTEKVVAALRRDAERREPGFHAALPGAASDIGEVLESWQRVDLLPALAGKIDRVEPTILRRDDGRALLYRGRVNGLHGDSGVGKSWVAAFAIAQEVNDGEHVVLVDFEDPDASTVVERLRILGVTDDLIATQLHYHSPTEFFSPHAVALIAAEITERDAALVVIDSLGEAFGLEGVDENKDAEVGPWLRRVCRKLADTGASVLTLDHSTKANNNPLHPSGSKRKRAAITGASYLVDARESLTREHGGRLRLTCAKDRHGYWRRDEVAAELEFTVHPDTGMTVHVWPPPEKSSTSTDARLLDIARAAVRAARDANRPLSGRELEILIGLKASAALKRAGIDRAITNGALRTEDGPRNSVLHYYVRDLSQ